MALAPQKFREIVLQILFSKNFSGTEGVETALWLMEELKVSKKAVLEAHASAQEIVERQEEIDPQIEARCPDYRFERISSLEKAVLRLAFFELLFKPEVPPKVVFAEGVRLARKFASPEGAQFVAAVLQAAFSEKMQDAAVP